MASLAGEAPAAAGLDADSLLARRGPLQQAVLALAVPSRRVLPETGQPVREGPAAVAAMGGEGLRVVLRIDSPALAGLPSPADAGRADIARSLSGRRGRLVTKTPRRAG